MLLQIIATQYNNGEECIKRLFDSIQMQQDVDFSDIEVLLINDGKDLIIDSKLFDNYSFSIKYFIEEWSGPSGVRQHGLDRATADYVMFADGDDLFYRNNALWEILKTLRDKQPDILTSQFATDMWKDDICTHFQTYNNENVWIHGKVFKKAFLNKYNIKWNKDLLLYEDSYFVRLCFAYDPIKINIDETIWFWKFRLGSITRSDEDWVYKTYVDKMKSNAALVTQFIQRGKTNDAANYAFVQIFETYFTLFENAWNRRDLAEYKEQIEKYFVIYWNTFSPILECLKPESAQVIIEVLRKRFYKDKKRLSLETITFPDWRDQLLDKWKIS